MQRYSVQHVLAEALYGQVLLCTDSISGDVVAIKRMNLAAAAAKVSTTGRHIAEDIAVERRVNRALSANGGHAHVLTMRADFVEDGCEHFVLDFCSDGELYEVLDRADTFSDATARRYLQQIAHGLAFMHQRGFAHRDVSLENVLVDDADNCHLCDFGLATPLSSRPTQSVGKPYYMAPEVVAGRMYDPAKADVWSLGVVLFIMLTGVPLFDVASETDNRFKYLATHGLRRLVASWGFTKCFTPLAMAVLERMLTVDADARWSLEQVIEHDYVDGPGKLIPDMDGLTDTMSKLLFRRRSSRKVADVSTAEYTMSA
ncbi:Aste57867_11784 [Aphanomyces stellatus]|uniref:Aste57867_11784 protein n=1 Tax=Aphanomyces stellatus TaxID=120398 RepID=A0A485KUF9_9STRA|nr:hypothetical protein As57867_011739 [Aphanomyces stellatus]VFT88640.1 Aste57867_11784 [Aphanomyces stellatus]